MGVRVILGSGLRVNTLRVRVRLDNTPNRNNIGASDGYAVR